MSVIFTLTISTNMLDVSDTDIDNMHAVTCDVSDIYIDNKHYYAPSILDVSDIHWWQACRWHASVIACSHVFGYNLMSMLDTDSGLIVQNFSIWSITLYFQTDLETQWLKWLVLIIKNTPKNPSARLDVFRSKVASVLNPCIMNLMIIPLHQFSSLQALCVLYSNTITVSV